MIVATWAFAAELGAGVALVTALAAIPVYLRCLATMLYDSMTQFFVAATGTQWQQICAKKNGMTR